MSEENKQTTEAEPDFKPKTVEMSREDFMKAEHAVQSGISETLPDGRTVKEVQNSLVALQNQQEQDIKKRGEEQLKKRSAKTGGTDGANFMSEKVAVVVHENGVTSASAIPETTDDARKASGTDGEQDEPENDLPTNLPGRKSLLGAGIVALEKVAALDRESLLGIPGIKEATAEKILSYGKSE